MLAKCRNVIKMNANFFCKYFWKEIVLAYHELRCIASRSFLNLYLFPWYYGKLFWLQRWFMKIQIKADTNIVILYFLKQLIKFKNATPVKNTFNWVLSLIRFVCSSSCNMSHTAGLFTIFRKQFVLHPNIFNCMQVGLKIFSNVTFPSILVVICWIFGGNFVYI